MGPPAMDGPYAHAHQWPLCVPHAHRPWTVRAQCRLLLLNSLPRTVPSSRVGLPPHGGDVGAQAVLEFGGERAPSIASDDVL